MTGLGNPNDFASNSAGRAVSGPQEPSLQRAGFADTSSNPACGSLVWQSFNNGGRARACPLPMVFCSVARPVSVKSNPRHINSEQKIRSFHIIGSREQGGAENFFVRMVEALNRAGHEAIAISRANGPVVDLFSPHVKQLHVPLASKWDLLSRWRLANLIREHKPAIVQTYMSRATRLTRVPRDSGAVHVARLGGYYALRGNYDHAHAWIGNTRDICAYLTRNGMPTERVYHIGNFVPQPRSVTAGELSAIRESLRLPDSAFVILALGRMIEKKGFQDLIEAFSMLPATHGERPLMLLLVGDGTERAKYEELARRLNVWERVRFAGWQTDTAPYYKLADLFVVPSRHEPLGNTILEGWTHGLPMVSTMSEGAHELVTGDRNALLVPIADPKGMAAGLRRMLELPEAERESLVNEGYKAARIHSEEGVVRAYVELYDKLAGAARLQP